MRAAVFYGRGDVRVEEVPDAKAGPGELLLKVAGVGICGTDAHEFDSGPHMFPIEQAHAVTGHIGPMIPGHELAGVVEDRGAGVGGFEPGALVVSGAGVSCGKCFWCERAMTNLCRQYSTLGLNRNGALAQYVAVPASTCVDASGLGITADTAALAQPMSIAVHAMRRGRLGPGESAVILGAGGIGAFLTYAAADRCDSVVVSDLDAGRLRIASALGAAHTVHAGSGRSVEDVLAANDIIPSVIYEVSGSATGFEQALSLAPRGARLVMVGLQHGSRDIDVRDVSLREVELIGTNAHVCGLDLPEALRLLASREGGWTDVAPVALSLDKLVEEGLRPLAERRSTRIKTLVDPWAAESRKTVAS
ncbi:alcohol dehydrogenase catalytic domain-containing protein [Amycolatopsis sp. K13G38]|uniref:Alcohol dehydrogenase catalytic domain-containing protein n=1 Tax=Amycolatopsis acididurans TaxID=2724524 RepID=A0ABX1J3Q9_9PSEU|nr:alcohol dehydrogenase catalytic domain-containing protein [Amycolatopsis acididurans]NKQ54299.1 alcohol dehydrogenase catalytic domain-containing protein [Amycolatopsis acididurans]